MENEGPIINNQRSASVIAEAEQGDIFLSLVAGTKKNNRGKSTKICKSLQKNCPDGE